MTGQRADPKAKKKEERIILKKIKVVHQDPDRKTDIKENVSTIEMTETTDKEVEIVIEIDTITETEGEINLTEGGVQATIAKEEKIVNMKTKSLKRILTSNKENKFKK